MIVVQEGFAVRAAPGTGPALLVRLARLSASPFELPAALRAALGAVGDVTGECWLNLVGLALDAGAPYDAGRLLEALRTVDPVELRRHLLGVHAWSWRGLVGGDALEAAAQGDPAAFPALLGHPRYYGGRAPDSLGVLLPLSPEETRTRLLRAAEAAARAVPPAPDAVAAAGRAAAAVLAAAPPLDAIERVTGGYRYVPEPEAEQVLLVPHLEPAPWLVLAQHRAARVVLYAAGAVPGAEERLAALGRALADQRRVEILGLLGGGARRVAELVEATGLTRSTVHHHLGQLRDAGLVGLEGNAREYAYVPRREALDELESLLAGLVRRRAA